LVPTQKHQVRPTHSRSSYTILTLTGLNSQHEVYEDLGLSSNAQLDPSFNANNALDFNVLRLPLNDPTRAIQFDCSLAGTTNMYTHARDLSHTQSPLPGLTASSSTSPTTPASRRASGMAMASINEQSCMDLTKAVDDFHLPSWDQLPSEFQNPATSAGFLSTIPMEATASVMDMGVGGVEAPGMAWEDHELGFDMDMDLDFATELANSGLAQ
jgi:hypothetical protein